MAQRISRRVIARHIADRLIDGDSSLAITQLAGFLIDTRRTTELLLIVRDIEDALAVRGIIIADVMSAHELTTETEDAIKRFLADAYTGSVHTRTTVEPSLLAGVRIRTPDAEFDNTARRKLTTLQTATKQ